MAVKFTRDLHQSKIIRKIAARAVDLARKEHFPIGSSMDVEMDVSATHASGCPLRLDDLLSAKDFDFIHDILGIRRHLDRDTGELRDCFVPRYAAPNAEAR